MLAKAAAVEKGEASSTTSSPKITNNIEDLEKEKERNSPESSTHPEAVSSCGLGENPKSLEQIIDESVSSTTKELNLDFKAKNSNNSDHSRDVKSGLKTKVELDPFGALIKDSTFAGKVPDLYFFIIYKGQLNSERIYEVIVSPKIPTKNYRDFCPTL